VVQNSFASGMRCGYYGDDSRRALRKCGRPYQTSWSLKSLTTGAIVAASGFKTRLEYTAERLIKTDTSRSILLRVMTKSTGYDVSIVSSLSVLLRTMARSNGRGNEAATRSSVNRFYSFSMTQCIDHPHKCNFSFQSVLVNTLEQLDIL
jgi:hypothetical protein